MALSNVESVNTITSLSKGNSSSQKLKEINNDIQEDEDLKKDYLSSNKMEVNINIQNKGKTIKVKLEKHL